MAEELHKGKTDRLRFIVEPSRFYQSRQFLSDLVRQIDIYGLHGNSILGGQSVRLYPLRVNPAVGSVKAPQATWAVRTCPVVTLR